MKGGVLIIGSLLWQDGGTNEPWNNERKIWREEYLVQKNKYLAVKAPIRYGRFSSSNKIPVHIVVGQQQEMKVDKFSTYAELPEPNMLYTMVLSKDCDKPGNLGTAYLCEFNNTIQLNTIEDIESCVKGLSKAEGIYIDEDRFFRKSWGGVSVLIANKCELKDDMYALWKKKLGNAEWLNQFDGFDTAGPILFNSGKKIGTLDIKNLVAVENSNQGLVDSFDFILAAVTVPLYEKVALKLYPTPKEIGVLAQMDMRRYFQQNIKNGVKTFEDSEIKKTLAN